MRISDWSADVCSSDLLAVELGLDQRSGVQREVLVERVAQINVGIHRILVADREAGAAIHIGFHVDPGQALAGFGIDALVEALRGLIGRSEEHTSELQSLMRNSYAVSCLKKNIYNLQHKPIYEQK